MKIAALISGGKDSWYAAYKASKKHKLSILISIQSDSEESYMFHVPNISLTILQARAASLPILYRRTSGIKEEELKDLKEAIKLAKKEHKIEGVSCGALASEYQRKRIAKICKDLNLELIAPMWGIEPAQHLKNLVRDKFEVVFVGVAAHGLGKEWLGKKLNGRAIDKLIALNKKYGIHIGGEGGEYESLVLNCPLFKQKLAIKESKASWNEQEGSGTLEVLKVKLENKQNTNRHA